MKTTVKISLVKVTHFCKMSHFSENQNAWIIAFCFISVYL